MARCDFHWASERVMHHGPRHGNASQLIRTSDASPVLSWTKMNLNNY